MLIPRGYNLGWNCCWLQLLLLWQRTALKNLMWGSYSCIFIWSWDAQLQLRCRAAKTFMVWSFTFINGFESINHRFATAMEGELWLRSPWLKFSVFSWLWTWRQRWIFRVMTVKRYQRFSPIFPCQLYRKDTFGLKTPLCKAMIDCVIFGVFFRKMQLKSWMLNYQSLFAQCPFSEAGLETSLEQSCCSLPPSELSPVSCGGKGCL